jgi:hypothetical protein
MAQVEYERGGNDLPQGAAAAANEAAAAVPTPIQSVPVPDQDLPMPDLGEEDPDFAPGDERDEGLFADAQGKGRDMPLGPSVRRNVPPEVIRKLPALARAASKSDAPPALVALYKMTLRALEDEMRENG